MRIWHAAAFSAALGSWGCAGSPDPVQHPAPVTPPTSQVSLPAAESSTPPSAANAPEEAALVRFEGAAKTDAPPRVIDFVSRFFASMKESWRSGLRFVDTGEDPKERADRSAEEATLADASSLVLAISLHRFHGSSHPPDTDSNIARLQAISQVRVLRFEEDAQVFRLDGETELKDGRVYGLSMVISKGRLVILAPL